MSTVGYGDISAGNEIERIMGMIAIIIGTGFYSYAIGNLTSLITGVDDDSAELDEKLSQIKEHQESQNLPDKLA